VRPRAPQVGELDEQETRTLFFSPLSVILAQCELARKERSRDERFDVIERQARRIRDLLERSRLPAQTESPLQEIDPVAQVRTTLDQLASLALARGVQVHLTVDDVPAIRANPEVLAHALRHLVRGAIEAAPEGHGDVTVAVGVLPPQGTPTHLAFAVADDGPGHDPRQVAQVFDTAAPRAGARNDELCYAVVQSVAIAMGASLTIDSEPGPGAGTRATMKVPLAAVQRSKRGPASAAAPASVAAPASPGRPRARPVAR
jgi:signal transduction histidine kinase